jgi:hypothetical protein
MSETGFLIDGKTYPVVAIPDMDMDELQLVYEACGITLQGWALRDSDDPEQRLEWEEGVANPQWMRVLLHVAYQRGNPDMPAEQVAKTVAKVKWIEATLPMMLEQDDDQEPADPNPVGGPSEPAVSSPKEPPTKPTTSEPSTSSSPQVSRPSSDEREGAPETTGISESGSDQVAAPLRQVV